MRIIFTVMAGILPVLCLQIPAQNMLLPDQGKWSPDFAVPGISGNIYATATDGNNLYVGGNFNAAGSTIANSIAMWDGTKWHSIGVGQENGVYGEIPSVEAMAFVDGKLFVGGQFARAGSVEVNGIAYWDGTQWNKLGNDSTNGLLREVVLGSDTLILRGFVYDLLAVDHKLYVGGDFEFAGDSVSNGIAIWNLETSSWETPDHGISRMNEHSYTTIFSLAAHENTIYAGGAFSFEPKGITARNIARWDGSEWSSIGEAASTVFDLETDLDGNLYATGVFPSEEDSTGGASGIGIWNGTSWISLNGPPEYTSHVSRIGIFNNELYAGGTFAREYVLPDQCLAKWNGSEWQIVEGLGQTYYPLHQASVRRIEATTDKLFIAGNFTRAGDTYALNIAELDPVGNTWKLLDDGNANLGIHDGRIMVLESKGDTIYAGGDFTIAGGTLARGIAMWTGTGWQPLGYGTAEYNGIHGMVYTILADSSNVFAGGYFDMAGGEAAFHIARWDGTKWWPMGIGVGGIPGAHVRAIVRKGDYVYVGGYFATVGDEENYELPANSIARFNLKTNRWQTLGRGIEYVYGVPGQVYDMEIHGDTIYVGGEFYNADEMFHENFAAIWGDKWMNQDKDHEYGIKGKVLKIKVIDDDLYIGGILKKETDGEPLGILKWHSGAWDTVGQKLTAGENDVIVYDMAAFDSGLVVGGLFTSAGDQSLNNLAYLNDHGWQQVQGGVLPGVTALAATDYEIYVAGLPQIFTEGKLNMGFARLQYEPPVIIRQESNVEEPGVLKVYPNPVRGTARISYTITDPGKVQVVLFDSQGRLIRTIVNEFKPSGSYTVQFNAGNLSHGIYFCRLITDQAVETEKIMVGE